MQIQPLLLMSSSVAPAVHRTSLGAPQLDRNKSNAPAEKSLASDRTKKSSQPEDTFELSEEALKATPAELTPEEQEQVSKLKQRDQEVKTHEQAHLAAAGPYARGGPTYTYQKGPDGQRYAIGGEVQIDSSPVEGDPEATIRKAQVIRAAANAPAEPSSQDRTVAANATKMESEARQELQKQNSQAEPTTASHPSAPSNSNQPASKATYANQQAIQAYQSKVTNNSSISFQA